MGDIRMSLIGFEYANPGFPKSNVLSQYFPRQEDKIVLDIQESNVLVIGDSLDEEDFQIILDYKGIKILYVSEPIGQFTYSHNFFVLFSQNMYHYAIGCISNKPGKWIKYPGYYNKNINFEEVNSFVSTRSLDGKGLCAMINRHDPGNTRVPIFRELSKFIEVCCPGKLENNCSNEEVDKIGNSEYLKNYIFNICSENFGECHPGYITEKLMNCCLGGAIPIYFGNLDSIDCRIFNKERILFLNHDNVKEVAGRVFYMLNDIAFLNQFYKQPVFLSTANEAMNEIEEGIQNFFAS